MKLRALLLGRARPPATTSAPTVVKVTPRPAPVQAVEPVPEDWLGPAPDPATAAFLEHLKNELAKGPLNLPCFPDIVPRVRQALDDPESSAADVVRIAATEPRLAARLLQTANSAVFNTAGTAVRDLKSAVTRLGHHLVQSVTLAFAIQQMKADATLMPVAPRLDALWERSMAVASICEVLARQLRVPTDKVFLTGLLHGIGHFYVLVRAAESVATLKLEELDQALIDRAHPLLGRAVLDNWKFEPIVCEAVAHQRDRQRESTRLADINDVVVAAVVLAEVLEDPDRDLRPCWEVTAFARLGLGPDELDAVLRHTDRVIGALRAELGA